MSNIKYLHSSIWFFLILCVTAITFMLFGFDTFFSKVKIDTTRISPPVNIELSQGTYKGSISLKWEMVDDAQSYTLYRSTFKDKNFEVLSRNIRENYFFDFDVAFGRTYYYKLISHKGEYQSGYSLTKSGYAPIEIPKLIASNGTQKDGIKIWWKAKKELEKYELYRYSSLIKEWRMIADSLKQGSYIDKDVQKGLNYYYKLRAYQNERYSSFSKSDRGFLSLEPPKKVRAGDGNSSFYIAIKWDKVESAKHYALYRAVKKRGPFKLLHAKIIGNAFEEKNVRAGIYYYYKVKAFNQIGSPFSKTERGFVSLKAPIRVMATDESKRDIIISWETGSEKGVVDLYRSLKKDRGFKRIAKDLTDDYFRDENLEPAVIYYYKAKVKRGGFSSHFSSIDSGYITIDFPTLLKASDGVDPYQIELIWQSAKVDYFKVFRSEDSKEDYVLIADRVVPKSFKDKNISYCKDYYYKIQSSKNGKLSSMSRWDSGYGRCGAFVNTFSGTGEMGDKNSKKIDKASFNRPTALFFSKGTLYVADTFNHRIRIITQKHSMTLAGSGAVGSSDGLKEKASFYRPTGIAVDAKGSIFVAEVDSHLIRKITPEGRVTTFAGAGTKGDRDGKGSQALFNKPYNIAIGQDGVLYVTELGNHKIRKITPDGVVSTFAGSGEKGNRDGSINYASFDRPAGIVIDKENNIYVSDSNNNNIRIISKGMIRSFAGSGKSGNADGKGVATSFNNPLGLALDKKGNIYVSDTGNHMIRMINKDGIVKTVAGSLKSGDKDGFEGDAAFFSPRGIAVDDQGDIYVTDFHAHKIRKITIRTK